MRRAFALVVAGISAVVGPRLAVPQSRDAGTPFVYEPPPGFVSAQKGLEGDEKTWIVPQMVPTGMIPRITTAHLPLKSTVEPADLAKTVGGLPQTFSESGVAWTLVRSETRTRKDGAKVGLVEGDCMPNKAGAAGAHFRALQLLFPDDQGTTVVKAYVSDTDASRYVPMIEATIDTAKGVATRLPKAPAWMYGAFGAAGAFLGWILGPLVDRARRRKSE